MAFAIVEVVWQAILGAQTEIVAFIVAIFAHQLFFGRCRYRVLSAHKTLKGSQGGASSPSRAANRASKQRSTEMAEMRQVATAGSATSAFAALEALPQRSAIHYNSLMEGFVASGDAAAVHRLMADAREKGLADATTYNTFMKIHLQRGDVGRAREAVAEMRSVGIQPNCTTFNELLNASLQRTSHNSGKAFNTTTWAIVDEMKAASVKPNRITLSILLKGVQPTTEKRQVERVLAMATQANDEPTDDVLLGSLTEACIRTGNDQYLKSVLQQQRSAKRVLVRSSHAYGSLIRAYGYVRDIEGAMETWRELRTRHVELTNITVGCMVEALVQSGDLEGGYALICELLDDPQTRPLINVVIYCSVLKGFSHLKKFDRVWALYEEMHREGMELTIVTYNALLDACARSQEMKLVPSILEAMGAQGVNPNVITYSTIIKGYCQDGRVDKALEVFEEMKGIAVLRPDEHTYNTVINGCARLLYFDKGLALFEEMCQVGIQPSNYTLSVLVKLAGRCRRTDNAFALCGDVSRKYGLRPNVHVYNNLVQACTLNKDLVRALEVMERMLAERVYLDARTYLLLLQASLDAGKLDEAASLLRAAFGLSGLERECSRGGGLAPDLVKQVLENIARSEPKEAAKLVRELSGRPGFVVSQGLQRQILSA